MLTPLVPRLVKRGVEAEAVAPMKTFLLSISLSLCAWSAVAQAKFSGEYIGIASPVKFTTNVTERVLVKLYFYPTGYAFAHVWSYGFDDLSTAEGAIDSLGRFSLLLDNGALLKGTVSGGIARGSATRSVPPRYTFAAPRRFKLAYDPDNLPE